MTYLAGTPDQRVITYDYDANRPWHIYSPAGTFTFGYDERGRRNKLTYPNGTQAEYGYDDLDRLTSLNHSVIGGSTFLANGYPEHDKVGNIKTRTGNFPASYLYDNLYRLEEAQTTFGTEKFTYDDVGNRESGPGPRDTNYEHDAANRMIKGRQYSYTYDNNGNQTGRTTPNQDKSWTLTWDYENRLTGMERTKGAEKRTVTFKYDPFGRRIEKKLVTIIDDATRTTTTTYVYDVEDIVLEILSDGATAITTRYVHGPGIDEPLALERNGQHYFYHQDGLGSVTAISEGSNVVQRYSYNSFGNPRMTTPFQNSYQFTGREWDKETGLYYYRARYYDPLEGRFLSKDTVSFGGGDFNLYGYVLNNPTNYTDPSGSFVFLLAGPAVYTGTMALADLTVAAVASSWLSHKLKTPNTGEPGTWHTNPGSGQERRYGPNGRPLNDIDWDHDHGLGVPHGHNWPDGKRDKGHPLSPWPQGRKPCKN